jgi:hypothetical protein
VAKQLAREACCEQQLAARNCKRVLRENIKAWRLRCAAQLSTACMHMALAACRAALRSSNSQLPLYESVAKPAQRGTHCTRRNSSS